MIRSWLILKVKNTNKIVILKRSKYSKNRGQWDFIGGSHNKKIKAKKLMKQEITEEVNIPTLVISLFKVYKARKSLYYYFNAEISKKKLKRLELNYEHSRFKTVDLSKLHKQKNLHHSIRIYLKYNK